MSEPVAKVIPWRNVHGEVRIDGNVESLNGLAGVPFFAGRQDYTDDIYAAVGEMEALRGAIGDAYEVLVEALLFTDSGGECAKYIDQAMALLRASDHGRGSDDA